MQTCQEYHDRGSRGAAMLSKDAVRGGGWTLVEMLMVIAIVGVLVSIALPKYQDYRERVRVAQAITDIHAINTRLRLRMNDTRVPPNSLAERGLDALRDPWGRPYGDL